jgi:hypothetical protein
VKRIFDAVRRYFSRFDQQNRWPFLWRIWLHAIVISYSAAALVQFFVPTGPRDDLVGKSGVELCLLVLVVGPFTETMLFQFLPLELTRAAAVRRSLRFAISVIPFAYMHLFAGMPTVVAAGFVGGLFFAFTYERWRSESVFVAIAMTVLLRSSFNLVGAVAMLLAR